MFGGANRPFESGTRISVHYRNPEERLPGGGGGITGPAVVLDLRKGQTALLPLIREKGLWTVRFDPPWQPVAPALAAEPGFAGPPRTGQEFVFRELANILAHGDARQRSGAAAYLRAFAGDVPNEFPHLLASAFGRDDNVWLEAGCAFLGVLGAPRTSAELVYGEASPPFHSVRQLVTWILWKGDRRDYPNRLIRCLLRNSGAYAWGAAVTLTDFKDSTVLIDGLNAALRREKPGSMMIAWLVVRAGQRAVLPEAAKLALKIVNRTGPVTTELQPAAQLVAEYGDDTQFEALVSTLVRFKQENEDHYRALWGAAGYGQTPRHLRLAAVLIDDRRFGFGTSRYCDIAAGVIQMVSGVKFIASQETPIQERDRAVARAAAWLKAHLAGAR